MSTSKGFIRARLDLHPLIWAFPGHDRVLEDRLRAGVREALRELPEGQGGGVMRQGVAQEAQPPGA